MIMTVLERRKVIRHLSLTSFHLPTSVMINAYQESGVGTAVGGKSDNFRSRNIIIFLDHSLEDSPVALDVLQLKLQTAGGRSIIQVYGGLYFAINVCRKEERKNKRQ